MSVFDSASNWPDSYKACGAPHQSPINLSQSFAKPCDRLCEMVIDDVVVPDATALISSRLGGTFLNFTGVKPTIRFNGKGYTAVNLVITSPSQHTIENVRAEAECMIIFEHPSEPNIIVSVLVRTSPGDTPSNQFFNTFVPYPSDIDSPVKVTLGNSWQLQNVIPEDKGYYVYEGTTPWPECDPNVTWVVFNTSVSMDPSDFAKMSSKAKGGYRPLQDIGDREVYFNDGEKVSNSFSKKDGKMYMRCRRVPVKGEGPPLEKIKAKDLEGEIKKKNKSVQETAFNNLQSSLGDSYTSLGGFWGLLLVLVFLYMTYFLFTEKGASVSVSIFNGLMFIPNAIHNFWVAVFKLGAATTVAAANTATNVATNAATAASNAATGAVSAATGVVSAASNAATNAAKSITK